MTLTGLGAVKKTILQSVHVISQPLKDMKYLHMHLKLKE